MSDKKRREAQDQDVSENEVGTQTGQAGETQKTSPV